MKVLQPGERVRLLTALVSIALISSTLIILVSAASCQPTPSPPLPIETSTAALATPTYTLAPTRTPTPEATPAHTPPPSPTPTPFVVVQAETLNVRSGPGTVYDRIGQVQQGNQLALLARNAAGDWYQVCCVNGQPGWVAADLVQPSSPAEGVPVALKILPTPTPVPVTPTFTPSPTPAFHCVYVGPTLCPGYDMGVDDSARRRDWVTDMNGYMRMAYPGGLDWGAVFITVGPLRDPPRPGQDFSAYRTLSVELRGEVGGEFVNIGTKDNTDPNNGSETKILASNLTTSWQPFTFALSEFKTADLTRLYVVIEFVFEPGWPAQIVYFQNVKYLP